MEVKVRRERQDSNWTAQGHSQLSSNMHTSPSLPPPPPPSVAASTASVEGDSSGVTWSRKSGETIQNHPQSSQWQVRCPLLFLSLSSKFSQCYNYIWLAYKIMHPTQLISSISVGISLSVSISLQWWSHEASLCAGETSRSWHSLDWSHWEGSHISGQPTDLLIHLHRTP